MDRRHLGPATLLIALCFAIALPSRGSAVPAEIRSNPDADTQKDKIKSLIEGDVALLVGTDASARSAARDVLITNLDATGGKPVSTQYLDTYSNLLRDLLTPHVSSPDMAVRLNIAIVAARTAEKCDNYRMQPVVEKLLDDKSDAVLIWALRGARFTLPPILRAGGPNAQNNKVLPGVMNIGKTHKSGLIMQEVYEALGLNLLNATGGLNQQQWAPMLVIVAPKVYELYRMRVDRYPTGVPNEPTAEQPAIKFLSHRLVLGAISPDMQTKIVQAMCDHTTYLSDRFKTAAGTERDVMGNMTKQVAGGLWSWANFKGNEQLKTSLNRISSMPRSEYAAAIQTVPDVLKQVAAADPGIKLIAPGAGPATQPSVKAAN